MLVPGGSFHYSEWGMAWVPIFEVFSKSYAAFKTPKPSEKLRRFREASALIEGISKDKEGREGIRKEIEKAGFQEIRVETVVHDVRTWSLEDSIQARFSREWVKWEVAEMADPEGFREDFRKGLSVFQEGGTFHFPWEMYYFSARA